MTDGVKAYEEKARDQWLFDYPAQVSLCGTQIWWTSEVAILELCKSKLRQQSKINYSQEDFHNKNI